MTYRLQRPTRQALLAAIPLTALLNAYAYAQPAGAPQGPTMAEAVSRFALQAETFIELIANEAGTVQDWAYQVTWLVVPVIILGAGIREYHENSAHGKHLFWWFGRLAVCLVLLGSGQDIISQFYAAGKEIATGNLASGYQSPLYNLFQQRELDFHVNYQNMINTQFQVKVGDNLEYGTFDPDGYKFLFPLYTGTGSEARDIMSKISQPKEIMQASFALMNVSRAVLELGNLWLVVLSGLLMLVYKVTCPIFIALAIDRRISHRMVHSWVWGLIVLTLVWPSVSYFLRAIAYLAGDLGLSVSSNDPIYEWNEETLTVIQNTETHPEYLIAFGSVMMLGSGLALWISPLIAYRLAYGQVFETVTQTASQMAASIGAMGVSMYNAVVGGVIERQAYTIQAQAGYDAGVSQASADRRAQDLQARAGLIGGRANIRAGRLLGLANTRAGLYATVKGIREGTSFDQKQAMFGTNLAKALTRTGAEKDAEEAGISAAQSLQQLYGSTRGQYWSLAGNKIGSVLPSDSSVVGRVGSAAGVGLQGYGIHDSYELQRQAAFDAFKDFPNQGEIGRGKNIRFATRAQLQAYDDNLISVKDNMQDWADERVDYNTEAANRVMAGIRRSANIQHQGITQATDLQLQANQIRLQGQVEALTINRTTAINEVALLQFERKLREAIYNNAAKLIEKHLEQRF